GPATLPSTRIRHDLWQFPRACSQLLSENIFEVASGSRCARCRVTVCENDSVVLTNVPRRNGGVGGEQFGEHVGLFFASDEKQNAPRAVEDRVGEGHAAPSHVDVSNRHVRIRHTQHWIAGNERSGVTIRPHAKMSNIENWRGAGQLCESSGTLF